MTGRPYPVYNSSIHVRIQHGPPWYDRLGGWTVRCSASAVAQCRTSNPLCLSVNRCGSSSVGRAAAFQASGPERCASPPAPLSVKRPVMRCHAPTRSVTQYRSECLTSGSSKSVRHAFAGQRMDAAMRTAPVSVQAMVPTFDGWNAYPRSRCARAA